MLIESVESLAETHTISYLLFIDSIYMFLFVPHLIVAPIDTFNTFLLLSSQQLVYVETNIIAERLSARQLILTVCAGMERRAYSEKC